MSAPVDVLVSELIVAVEKAVEAGGVHPWFARACVAELLCRLCKDSNEAKSVIDGLERARKSGVMGMTDKEDAPTTNAWDGIEMGSVGLRELELQSLETRQAMDSAEQHGVSGNELNSYAQRAALASLRLSLRHAAYAEHLDREHGLDWDELVRVVQRELEGEHDQVRQSEGAAPREASDADTAGKEVGDTPAESGSSGEGRLR